MSILISFFIFPCEIEILLCFCNNNNNMSISRNFTNVFTLYINYKYIIYYPTENYYLSKISNILPKSNTFRNLHCCHNLWSKNPNFFFQTWVKTESKVFEVQSLCLWIFRHLISKLPISLPMYLWSPNIQYQI